MFADAAFAFLHFIFLLIMVSALGAELFILRLPVNAASAKLLARVDMFYGLSAGLLIAAGAGRVWFGLTDEGYYLANHSFWGKIATFIIIGLLSIWPTVKFMRWSRAAKKDDAFTPPPEEVKAVRRVVAIETHLLALVVLFAVLMARGIG